MAAAQVAPSMRCTKCDSEYPWTLDFFPKSSERNGKVYLQKRCRDCTKAYDRERWATQPSRRAAHAVAVQRERNENPNACRERHKAWRDANPDKVRALWQRNYAKNGEKHLAKNALWRAENPDLCRAYRRDRRALEAAGGGYIRAAEYRAIEEQQGGICFYCETAPIVEFDHFIPLIRGGKHISSNIRGSCLTCNRSKSVKMPWEWKPDRFSPP